MPTHERRKAKASEPQTTSRGQMQEGVTLIFNGLIGVTANVMKQDFLFKLMDYSSNGILRDKYLLLVLKMVFWLYTTKFPLFILESFKDRGKK